MNFMTVTKTYKSEQSYLNQMGFFRLTHNQVRINKETTKFTKIKTSGKYDSLLQEMQDLNQYEYICAGLNSFQREVVVIDSDDASYGMNTLSKLSKDNIVPHCQKVKSNGHSQTYFFIEPFFIGNAGFHNGKYWEKDDVINHEQWKRLTKMMNYLYDGDICYTGYNCQNPLYVNANVTSYKNINKLYTVQELYDICLEKFANVTDLDYYLKYLRSQALLLKPKHQKKIDDIVNIVIKFKETEANQFQSNHSIITNVQLLAEYVLDETDKIIERSINERIFIVCCQIAKSFHNHQSLDWDHYEEIAKTAYNNFIKQDEAIGYTCQNLIDRIRADIRQIMFKDSIHQIDWNKVGYTDEQRKLSLITRQTNKENRKAIIIQSYLSIITNVQLSENKKAEYISAEWNIHHENDKISSKTVKRYLKEIETESKETKSILSNDNLSIITNVQLSVQDLANLALDIQNTNYNMGEHTNEIRGFRNIQESSKGTIYQFRANN
jgi:DNA polymerase III delta prime subunit